MSGFTELEMPKKCLLLKFKCQQFFCIYTTLIVKLKNLINSLVLLWPCCDLAAKNAEADLVWRVMSSFAEDKAQIFQPFTLSNSDTSAVIFAS